MRVARIVLPRGQMTPAWSRYAIAQQGVSDSDGDSRDEKKKTNWGRESAGLAVTGLR